MQTAQIQQMHSPARTFAIHILRKDPPLTGQLVGDLGPVSCQACALKKMNSIIWWRSKSLGDFPVLNLARLSDANEAF